MNVLIVGRTIMSPSTRCIGGIAADGKSVRLLPSSGDHWPASAPFQVGEIWDIAYTPATAPKPPHTEDVSITRYNRVGVEPNLQTTLLAIVQPWRGSIAQIFDGVVGYTSNHNGYVCERLGVPAHSTWFWIPDRDLLLRSDGKHYDYVDGYSRGLAYVGEKPALPTLAAGTLIRVSLARWWKPNEAESDFEERCYLQLSGWYT